MTCGNCRKTTPGNHQNSLRCHEFGKPVQGDERACERFKADFELGLLSQLTQQYRKRMV